MPKLIISTLILFFGCTLSLSLSKLGCSKKNHLLIIAAANFATSQLHAADVELKRKA